MSSDRAAALADAFAAASSQAIDFAQSCGDDQWSVVVPGEDWTVGVVLHHTAEGMVTGSGWLSAMCRGQAVTNSVTDIDHVNEQHAMRAADIGRDETLALLVRNGAQVEQLLRSLTDTELDTVAPFGPTDGRELRAFAMAEASIGHVRGHLGHAIDAVEAVTS